MQYLTPDEGGGVYLCRSLRFRAELASVITGALELLTHAWAWEAFGDMTPEECAALANEALISYLESGDMCMIGTIVEYITTEPPEGVLALDGTTYDGADYPDLFALLDDTFKAGDQFTLPDARGRTAVFAGAGSGLSARGIGDSFGTENHVLTLAEMPEHAHSYDQVPADYMEVVVPGEGFALFDINAGTTGAAGGDEPHNNMQPSIVWRVGVRWK